MPWEFFDPRAEHRRPITSLADLLDRIEAIADLRALEPGPPTTTTQDMAEAFDADLMAAEKLGVFGGHLPPAISVAVDLTYQLTRRETTDFATAQNLRDAVASAREVEGGERKRIKRRNPATQKAQKMLHNRESTDAIVKATGLDKDHVNKMRFDEGLT